MARSILQGLKPARPRGLSDNDLGDVVCLRVVDHVVGDTAVAAGDGDGFAAKRLCEPECVGNPVALLLAKLGTAPASSGIELSIWTLLLTASARLHEIQEWCCLSGGGKPVERDIELQHVDQALLRQETARRKGALADYTFNLRQGETTRL